MDKEFGYFLLSIGIAWALIISPLDTSFMRQNNAIPIGLIIVGALTIILSYFRIEHISGMLFLIFIVLWIKSGNLMMMPSFNGLTENYYNELEPQGALIINCGVCKGIIKPLSSNLIINSTHSQGLTFNLTTNENTELVIGQNSEGISSTNYLTPENLTINYSAGIGELEINALNANASIGIGSIKAELLTGQLSTGIGSIDLIINQANNSPIKLSTGIGLINIKVAEGIECVINADTGLGGVTNLIQERKHESKVFINASAGIGTIRISGIQ